MARTPSAESTHALLQPGKARCALLAALLPGFRQLAGKRLQLSVPLGEVVLGAGLRDRGGLVCSASPFSFARAPLNALI